MSREAEEFLYVIDLKTYDDVEVESGINEYSWDEFKEKLLTHQIRSVKNGMGFMPVMMKPENEWVKLYTKKDVKKLHPHYRGDVNVEALTSIVIDCDKAGAIEEAEKVFGGYEYIVYSTHNFRPETPWKYRMVLRLHEPIAVENWAMCFEAMKSRIDIDSSCCNPSRLYYYPSHSVDSNISPRAFHRPGKAISMEEILSLAADPNILDRSRITRYRQVDHSERIKKRRHFSGQAIGAYDSVTNEDLSMKRYMQEHNASIQNYMIEDSRHNLALTVTGREIEKYGPMVDYKSLLVFLFKIAADKGSRGMETGDTPDELPGMIITAMLKYAPEAYETAMTDHDGKLEAWLSSMINWASLHYKEIRMPDAPTTKAKEGNSSQDYYLVLRERHRKNLEGYMKNQDIALLTKKVLSLELKVEKPRYKEIARALVNFQYGMLTRVNKKSPDQAWRIISEKIPALRKIYTAENIPSDPKKIKYAMSAFLVECAQRIPQQISKHADKDPAP